MKLNINRHMLTKTGWDSGSITSLSALMHRFAEPGRFEATVMRGKEPVGRFGLIVDEKCPKTPVKIDLGAIDQAAYTVNPRCYTVFQAPGGSGGYYVAVSRIKDERRTPEYNSQELQSGDIYIAALLHPGDFSITNQAGARGHITVVRRDKAKVHPRKGRMRYITPDVIRVECTDKWFRPDRVQTESGQSVSFMIKEPGSRIRIRLEKKEEGGPRRIPRKKRPLKRRKM